jgi:DNA-binding Xre family transcriptional regulator
MRNSPIIVWRLRECMANAGIESVQELHDRINCLDPKAIRYAFLARIVKRPPVRLNLNTLGLLARVLKCNPGNIVSLSIKDGERCGASKEVPERQ